MVCLPPNLTNSIYIVTLLTMIYIKSLKDRFRLLSKTGQRHKMIRNFIVAISIFDLLNVLLWYNLGKSKDYLVYPWVTNLLRPVYTITVLDSVRRFSIRYLKVIKGSLPMVIFILLFVLYFSWVGQRIFSDTVEGVE
jgi:hypothetical protein